MDGTEGTRRIWCKAPGLWLPGQVRRILQGAGLQPLPALPGLPRPGDGAGCWGMSPLAPGAEAFARRHGLPLIRIEDAFLRSILPGRAGRKGDGPLGLLIDDMGGIHFDPSRPSRLETILATHPLDDPVLLARADEGIARLKAGHLSKYNAHDPDLAGPPPGYVLLIDQTLGDASVRASGGDRETFARMLELARARHPDRQIVLRIHPETARGLRPGHWTPADMQGCLVADPRLSPWTLLAGAHSVWTLSSQMGFEAILAGHRPHVLGAPFYAGWGLSCDHGAVPDRRGRQLQARQLFAAAMILAPHWHDPCRDRSCSFEEALDQLDAEVTAWRQDRAGYVARGIRLWKRRHMQQFFGREKPLVFSRTRQPQAGQGVLVWAAAADPALPGQIRIEDGLIRSRGLGARLIPPLSMVRDDLGIHYDPSGPSRLERQIAEPLRPAEKARARALIDRLVCRGITKYNLAGDLPVLPEGRRILVPGQVEDDASILRGAAEVRTNLGLLQAARAHNPDAIILWKPHPDVETGLRRGVVGDRDLAALGVVSLAGCGAAEALAVADEVWTMTSGMGFEALLRGVPVTCLGWPFYAGWGLTRDLGTPPPGLAERRAARPDIAAMAHAVLIRHPRNLDPVSRRPCPTELLIERLESGQALPGRPGLRLLSRLQGMMASQAWIWRGR